MSAVGAMPPFCRHNRFLANCPICSREQAAAAPRPAPRTRSAGARKRSASASAGPARSRTQLRTRQLDREADDGYRSELVPGVKATTDAERLARALATAAARLEHPGPYEAVAVAADPEDATWLAFLLALAGPGAPELRAEILAAAPAWADGDPAGLDPGRVRTAGAYRAWAARAGSQRAGFTGEAAWTPARRFSRVFERLALPGFGRAARFDLLVTLGAAGVYELEADSLHLGGGDPTTTAAKRALVSGDVLLLERRAAALADAAGIPLAALDQGLTAWNAPGGGAPAPPRDAPALPGVRAALGLG